MTSSRRRTKPRPRPHASQPVRTPQPPSPTSTTGSEQFSTRVKAFLAQPGGTLIVLRAFLGATFTFAGLEKLANPNFFKAGAPASFAAQVRGAILTSPLHGALRPALHAPVFFALLVAFGELAAGLGTLFGLFGRIAAGGGMLLSFSFFLTVSFHASPYYYGADIVFLFAWTPFLLGGSGELSLDTLLAKMGTTPTRRSAAALDRRTVLGRVSAAGGMGVFALALAAVDNVLGSHLARTPETARSTTTIASTSPSTTSGSTQGSSGSSGTEIGLASAIRVGGALGFTDQIQGIPAYCVHKGAGDFVAFSAICTHAGCTVGFNQSTTEFVCPCHGSIYDALTGAVVQGPAPSPLPTIAVRLDANGTLYATD